MNTMNETLIETLTDYVEACYEMMKYGERPQAQFDHAFGALQFASLEHPELEQTLCERWEKEWRPKFAKYIWG